MTKFSDLKLNPKVMKAIEEAGYETPTPIQAGAIPPALEGRDVLGIAQTGTGKTASFTLPMLSLLARGRARARMPRSLVLCPTRELAAQVAENFDTYSKHLKLTKALLIGGVSFGEQDKLIDKGVDVLIATPGRLLDHFERGKLLLTGVQIMVVDEADRMLDMGFIPDIERIFSLTPFTRQTLFFSATMAPEIERITNTFLQNPERIEVARQASASETIEQGAVMFKPSRRDRSDSEKRKLLRAMIDAEGEKCSNAIIFCNRKMDVDTVAKSLKKHGYDAAPIHGDLDQSQRTRTLDGFRRATCGFSLRQTWPRAGWMCLRSAMCSTTTCRAIPRITSTASGAPGAPGGTARRSRFAVHAMTSNSTQWKSCCKRPSRALKTRLATARRTRQRMTPAMQRQKRPAVRVADAASPPTHPRLKRNLSRRNRPPLPRLHLHRNPSRPQTSARPRTPIPRADRRAVAVVGPVVTNGIMAKARSAWAITCPALSRSASKSAWSPERDTKAFRL